MAVIDDIIHLACRVRGFPADGGTRDMAVDQDLSINGDVADEFLDGLSDLFGDWVLDWPWPQYVNFNEPPATIGPKIWTFLRLPNPQIAFPGYTQHKITLGHIASVIEKGEWFEP